MSKKRGGRPTSNRQSRQKKQGEDYSFANRMVMDALINEYARLGASDNNLLSQNDYVTQNITQNYQLINALYRGDWIAGKIVDTIPNDMVKNWYSLNCTIEPEMSKQLKVLERKTMLKQRILEGLRWGRLYGGAAGIIVVKGQEDMLEEPLDMSMVMPGTFKGIIITDRWSGVSPSSELVDDICDPDFGLPKYYTFALNSAVKETVRVHHSRVIRFCGRDLPYTEKEIESYWGMSEIEHVYTELNKRNTTSANIAQLVFVSHLRVLKMDTFGQDLAFGDPMMQNDLYNTLMAQNKLMNNMSLQIMSKDDDFQTFQYTFSGLSDIYQQFMMDVAGAAEIPVTRLFGRSASGLNATGEGDLTDYYDVVRQWQEAQMRPILDKLLPIMCLSAFGGIPDDLDYEFNTIRDATEAEKSTLIQTSSNAINSVFQSGIISQKTALKELRDTGTKYGAWSNITDDDIENADDGTQQQGMGGMMGMMGGGMPPVDPNDPNGGVPPEMAEEQTEEELSPEEMAKQQAWNEEFAKLSHEQKRELILKLMQRKKAKQENPEDAPKNAEQEEEQQTEKPSAEETAKPTDEKHKKRMKLLDLLRRKYRKGNAQQNENKEGSSEAQQKSSLNLSEETQKKIQKLPREQKKAVLTKLITGKNLGETDSNASIAVYDGIPKDVFEHAVIEALKGILGTLDDKDEVVDGNPNHASNGQFTSGKGNGGGVSSKGHQKEKWQGSFDILNRFAKNTAKDELNSEDDGWNDVMEAIASLSIDNPELVDDGGDGSGNFGHAGRPGKVGGSSPDTVFYPEGESKENHQVFVRRNYPSWDEEDSGVHVACGFSNEERAKDHYNRHGADFADEDGNVPTQEEYIQMGKDFLAKPFDAYNEMAFVRENGDIMRYNFTTQEFAVGRHGGNLKSYYKPNPMARILKGYDSYTSGALYAIRDVVNSMVKEGYNQNTIFNALSENSIVEETFYWAWSVNPHMFDDYKIFYDNNQKMWYNNRMNETN